MGRLSGKHVLVTAGAQGIGRACVEAFLQAGAEVYAADLNPAALQSIATPLLHLTAVDGTKPEEIAAFVSSAKRIDAAVHCIGYVHQGSVLECNQGDWRQSFMTNVDSFFWLLQEILPRMRTLGGGSIVCIASVASSMKGLPKRAAYGASKAALIGLVKSVAADYVAEGIRCNAVCPGTVSSPSLGERIKALGDSLGDLEKARTQFLSRQPMNRLGTPDEIAALCLYLSSDESRFLTGQAIAIDGGITI